MRQFKFRGRNITTRQWVYGCLVNNLWKYSEHHSLNGHPVCEIISDKQRDDYDCWEDVVEGDAAEEGEGVVTVDPKTVGQFTGLNDKNGKEIYEGDILLINGKKTSVVYEKGCFYTPYKSPYGQFNYRLGALEIISVEGNIYEHPELLHQ